MGEMGETGQKGEKEEKGERWLFYSTCRPSSSSLYLGSSIDRLTVEHGGQMSIYNEHIQITKKGGKPFTPGTSDIYVFYEKTKKPVIPSPFFKTLQQR